ncbi:uncharacterized protein LOC112056428 [Bicyclus anynana]|uniref:Uncharacterized protein LOC112056428 n=1 Tax=Bicyclus anynana TaxID=110368 RepID=A0ABM3LMU1_BICAN|nr:uncharacterized protein LOC112056428 [Bicyclus anynana]
MDVPPGFLQSTSYDMKGIVSGNRMAAVPLGTSLGEGELDIEGVCTGPGMTCQNCTHAVTCIPLPGGWLKVPLQQCTEGQTCNAHLKQCSTEAVPECDAETQQYRHVCEQVGIFPDAYDCRKFHLCSPPDGLPDGRPADHRTALCPRHYGYDPKTAQCSIQLQHGQCNLKPVPNCTKVGQFGVLESSPNHYYVCISRHGTLYPQIFICPHGWHFWDTFCRPEEEIKREQEARMAESLATSTTVKPAAYKLDTFFSTEKATTYAADTFLADKFDLTNYETIDDSHSNSNDEFINSFENSFDPW